MSFSRETLNNKSLDSISDNGILSKVLSGIKKSDLDKIPNGSKVNSFINIINASLSNDVPIKSNQVN